MRKLAAAAVSFSAAVLLSQYLLPAAWLACCCGIAALLSLLGLFFKANTRLRLFLILLGLSAGFAWCFTYACIFIKPAQELNGTTQTVSAVVCGEPDITEYGSKVLVKVNRGGAPGIKAQLYVYGSTVNVQPGNRIEFTARFRIADTIYGEKTETFFAKGIYLLATAQSGVTVSDAIEPILFLPTKTAQSIGQMITRIFTKDTAAFMRALILGDTTDVYKDTALSGALSATGTSHIISVSGMNIAFLMGFLALFIRKKRVLTAVGIPIILLFMAMVGFQPPVVRAGIMQMFLLTAPIFKRENDNITSLSASLMLILLVNPYTAGSVGLQLSFSATLGILLFTEKLYSALDSPLRKSGLYQNRLLKASIRFIIASFATTIGALILSIPLIALHFGSVSLIAPLTNMLILWAVTLAFCGGIVAVIFGFIFMPIGTVMAFIVALFARYIIHMIEFLAHMPFASIFTANPAVVIWLVYVYILLVSAFRLHLRLRPLVYSVCLSAITLCLILFITSVLSDSHALSVTALDVGQGQSIVITSGKYTAVIDCGSSSGKDAGDIVTKYLQSHGRTSIDLLILTHYHSDHANGVVELLERNRVAALAEPDPSIDGGTLQAEINQLARDKGIHIMNVTENLLASFDDPHNAVLALYAPIGSDSENERGLTVLCSENNFDALITGDMNADIERTLVNTVQLPDIELLIVGHHGSKSSTSDELLDAVKPETAIISVGYNTYGHPSPDTLKKLALKSIMTYRTDEAGSVTINGW